MTVNQEFDSFLDRLRPYIIDYLQEKGFDTTKNFCCLNPDHDDNNPSMTAQQVEKHGYRAFCFSCNAILDIFDVYAILEDKPRSGPGYMREVILPLANKYGVKPPVAELSQKEQFCYDLYKIYGEVASMLDHGIEEMNDKPRDYILGKEWTEETLESLEIGVISFQQIEKRFDRDLIEKFGLNRPDVFHEDNIVFAVKDEKGKVIRFFARIMDSERRWQSTSSSKLLYDVWANHGRLYLSHLLDRKLNYAILVEGQPDAITLTQNGFRNVVATCGTTAFSEAHSIRLAFLALTETIIIYDNDNAGKLAVKKLLQQDFVKKSGTKYSIVNLINAKDPDEYVRKFGKNKLQHLIDLRLSSFRYMLSQFSPDDSPEEVAQEVLPYIACNKSDIAREVMVRDLAKYLKDEISVSSILSDVRKLDDEVRNEIEKRQKLVVRAAYKEADGNPEQAIGILREATDRLQDIEKESGAGGNLESSTISRIQICKQWEEKERSEMPTSFKFLPNRMDNIQKTFASSSWTSGQLIYIGAVENMGKSSFVNDMAWQMASIKDNQTRVLMHTIDDSAEDLIRRMVCQAYGSPYLTINMVANPQIFYEEEDIENVYEMREEAYAKFMEVVSDGRIFIKDATDGTTISFAESQIRDIRRKYPDDNLVYFLDNFHNVTDWPMLDQRNKFTKVSKELQRISTIYKCNVVSTVEYRKNDPSKIGTNEDVAECITDDMRIVDYDTGIPTRIADIKTGTKVNSLNTETFDIEPKRIINKFDKGIQECFRVNLKDGSYIEGTGNHPLFREDGSWVKIKDLEIGVSIGVPGNIKVKENKETLNNDMCRFLGYLAGDGCYTTPSTFKNIPTPRFTNSEEEIVKDFMNIVEENFEDIKPSMYKHFGSYEIRLSRKKGTDKSNSVVKLLKSLEILGQKGKDKKIPSVIFSGSKEGKASYLSGLFSTDGTVGFDEKTGKKGIRLFSTSPGLAIGAKRLLLQIGISSSISSKIQWSGSLLYSLFIATSSFKEFFEKITLVGKRQNKLEALYEDDLNTLNRKKPQEYNFMPRWFASEWHNHLISTKQSIRINSQLNPAGYQVVPTHKINRNTFNTIDINDNNFPNHLRKYLKEDCCWREIKSIEKIGKQHVWDLEIEDNHNFVANEIVCHNSRSMKFDAKVIMHIFSDLHAVGSENAELIHKHEGAILPRILVRVGKNKLGNFKGDLWFDFYPSSGLFMSVNSMKAKSDLETRRSELKGIKEEEEEERPFRKRDTF